MCIAFRLPFLPPAPTFGCLFWRAQPTLGLMHFNSQLLDIRNCAASISLKTHA
ncbi:hypothetical protein LPJ81_001165, partial [Coemansia sp. IMI 209127]